MMVREELPQKPRLGPIYAIDMLSFINHPYPDMTLERCREISSHFNGTILGTYLPLVGEYAMKLPCVSEFDWSGWGSGQ